MMLRAAEKAKKFSSRIFRAMCTGSKTPAEKTMCTGSKTPAEKPAIPPIESNNPKAAHCVAATATGAAAGVYMGVGSVLAPTTSLNNPIDSSPTDPTTCIWCNKSKTVSPDCTTTKCANSGFESIVEACKTHLNDCRFPCYDCKGKTEPFLTMKELKEHYDMHHPSMSRTIEVIACGHCRARFHSKADLEDHLTRTDRYQCPLKNGGEVEKEFVKRFLEEKRNAEDVFKYLQANRLWKVDEDDEDEAPKKKEEPGEGKVKKKGGKSKK